MKTYSNEKSKNQNTYELIKQKQKKRKSRRRTTRIILRFTLLIGFCVALVLCLLFLTPFFNIKTIDVVGTEQVDQAKILTASGIAEGENIFRVNRKDAKEQIGLLPYVKTVNINIKSPSKMAIEITESKMIGYIPYMSSYVGIDESCKILEISDKPFEGKTRIDGVEIKDAVLGTTLEVNDKDKFSVVVKIIDIFYDAEMVDKVTSVSIEKLSDIIFYYDNRVKVVCGSYENFEKKVLLFQGVNNHIGENIKGTITLTADGKAIFGVE